MTASRLFKFSLFIRIFVIILQVICNKCVPDHNADAFRFPYDPETGIVNKIVSFLFDGFTHWDAQYFLHISLYGYTHENTLAFFPLFPFLLRDTSRILSFITPSQLGHLHCTILAGVVLNALITSLSTVALYKLTFCVFQSDAFAFTTGLLFCLNPASVFFSALYSESLFAFFTFFGLWALEARSHISLLLLSLSAGVRSNGVIAAGYLIFTAMKQHVEFQPRPYNTRLNLFQCLMTFSKITVYLVVYSIPFLAYQVYSYLLFCTAIFDQSDMPEVVVDFVTRNDLKIPSEPSKWCNWNLPLSYSYVQSRYWDVGFLNYFSIKQIPNFVLAMPIIIIIIGSSIQYFYKNWSYVKYLGLVEKKVFEAFSVYSNPKCFPYFVHMFVSTVFCSLFIHIQVLTRMICSSSPLLYWVASMALLPTNERLRIKLLKEQSHNNSIKGSLLFLKKIFLKSSMNGKVILCYFIAYFFIGTFLHVNFFPWT